MPKFTVCLIEQVRYRLVAEGEDAFAAEQAAIEMWTNSADPDRDFGAEGLGVDVDDDEETIETT